MTNNEEARKEAGFYTPLPTPKKKAVPLYAQTLGHTYIPTQEERLLRRRNLREDKKRLDV